MAGRKADGDGGSGGEGSAGGGFRGWADGRCRMLGLGLGCCLCIARVWAWAGLDAVRFGGYVYTEWTITRGNASGIFTHRPQAEGSFSHSESKHKITCVFLALSIHCPVSEIHTLPLSPLAFFAPCPVSCLLLPRSPSEQTRKTPLYVPHHSQRHYRTPLPHFPLFIPSLPSPFSSLPPPGLPPPQKKKGNKPTARVK